MCVCVSSARRTTATRLPEGSGSPGEFPVAGSGCASGRALRPVAGSGCASGRALRTARGRVAQRTAIRQRAGTAVALPNELDRLVG
eukprot:6162094-Prymnesium_polylepis.1